MTDLAQLFLQYDYAETKDLCKQFLTLVTGVLVFSLAFSDKIVNFPTAPRLARRFLLWAWCSMIGSIILCGIGLCYITVAAGQAVYGGEGYFDLALVAWRWIIAAGVWFVVGLGGLMGAGIVSIVSATDDASSEPLRPKAAGQALSADTAMRRKDAAPE